MLFSGEESIRPQHLMPLHRVSTDKTSYLTEINQGPHSTARPSWPGTKSCYLIVLTLLACTGTLLQCQPSSQADSSASFNCQNKSPCTLPAVTKATRLFFFFHSHTYLCPANSLECQSPSGWISPSGSTCLSPLSSVCDAPMDLQGTERITKCRLTTSDSPDACF